MPSAIASISQGERVVALDASRTSLLDIMYIIGAPEYTGICTGCECILRSMTKRLSLILGEGDQLQLEPFIQAGTGPHQVLQRWADAHGVGSVNSEAAAIRALLHAGVEALRDDVLDEGYAELAQVYNGVEEHDERRSARDRYVARTEATL